MTSCLVRAPKSFQIAFFLVLASTLSGWTCSGAFVSCPGAVPQPQLIALSPKAIPVTEASVLLTVKGSGFQSQSEILWNGNPLQTRFVDSTRLQATITQDTIGSFGGAPGNDVLISVMSPGWSDIVGCANGGSSATLVLIIE